MSAEATALSADARRGLVQRIAASRYFCRSPRLRELLFYVCERALENRPEELREQLIGHRVFGRRSDYSPGEDNIVRVEVRQLRRRLEQYFEAEGRHERLIVTVPKGTYVPEFQPRRATPAGARSHHGAWLTARITLAALAGIALWAWFQNHAGAHAMGPPLWPQLFNRDAQILIVCADSALPIAEALRHQPVSLEDYLKRDYTAGAGSLPDSVGRLLRVFPEWQFTEVADLRLIERLHRINAPFWDRVAVRSARTIQIQDFKDVNAVLLGTVQSNPWDHLFEQDLNFRFEFDAAKRAMLVRNRAPRAGEPAVYQAAEPGASGEAYSTIAFLPNLRWTGRVLLIGGSTSDATEAAGDYVTEPETYAALMRTLTKRSAGRLPYFEVLLKSRTFEGVTRNPELVAWRTVSPQRGKPAR